MLVAAWTFFTTTRVRNDGSGTFSPRSKICKKRSALVLVLVSFSEFIRRKMVQPRKLDSSDGHFASLIGKDEPEGFYLARRFGGDNEQFVCPPIAPHINPEDL